MSVSVKKKIQLMTGTALKKDFKAIAILSSLALSLIVSAQTKTEQVSDSDLLNSFIQSKGYGNTITFTSSNIKQFWIDKSVSSQNNLIKILFTEGMNSQPYKIQLANVNETLDCKVDIISNTPDLRFSVLSNTQKEISESTTEDKFLNYNIASASFHLENTNSFSFYLQFSSSSPMEELSINKIILSFSDNKNTSFLASPGTLVITDSNCTAPNLKKADENGSFTVTGKWSDIVSDKKIYVSDNPLAASVKVKNIGEHPCRISLGYAPYAKGGLSVKDTVNPYKSNKILKVVSAVINTNSIIVDSNPEWEKGCVLALNAKEDLSDFPNLSFVDGKIQDVKKIDDNQFEIFFDKTNKKDIAVGTTVRVQSRNRNTYFYTGSKTLQPGEEATLSSTIKKDENCFQLGGQALCRGIYYVIPILISSSSDANEDNTIQISDFTVSY